MSKEQYFENRNNYISGEDKAWVTDYCQRNWPEEVNHILRIADDAIEHTFCLGQAYAMTGDEKYAKTF